MLRHARPTTVDEALGLLAEAPWCVLAGGTDIFPGLRDRPMRRPVLDITAIPDLTGIRRDGADWRIGACTTWTEIINAALPTAFDALKLAARDVGACQVQNAGTIAGNLCNASPAADGVPPLLVLDAAVELSRCTGTRRVALADFITGNRRTVRAADEIVTAVLVPAQRATGVSRFRKLGARRYLVISIAMVAVRLDRAADGTIRDAAVAVGACSEVARRMPLVERALVGTAAGPDLPDRVAAAQVADLTPIDDVRATAGYRHEAIVTLTRRAISDCVAAW